ncbi:hypothetical protein GF324_10915 [bacterium]|nr:hypothetical protein [bacterium]
MQKSLPTFVPFAGAVLAAAVFLWIGCEGKPGADGKDVDPIDHTAPDVRWLWPPGNTNVFYDSITFVLHVEDSEGEVAQVRVFVNGSDSLRSGTVLRKETPPWIFPLDESDLAGLPRQFTVYASAEDTSGNRHTVPTFILQRHTPEGEEPLVYYSFQPSDSIDFLPMPFVRPNRTYREIAVRFSALWTVDLIEAVWQMYEPLPDTVDTLFSDPYNTPAGIQLILRSADEEGMPGEVLDSLFIQESYLNYAQNTQAPNRRELHEWGANELPYRFSKGEEFYLGLRAVRDEEANTTGVYVRMSPDPGASPEVIGRTLLLGDDGEWYSTRTVDSDSVLRDLYAHVVIRYFSPDSIVAGTGDAPGAGGIVSADRD